MSGAVDSATSIVIGDIALVLALSWPFGSLARRCGQPAVTGQILTGILLGPSLLGRLPGHITSHLFPAQGLSYLSVLSQVAIVVFMFGVGYEIDTRPLQSHRRVISFVALSAFLVPMALGTGSVALCRSWFAAVGDKQVGGQSFALFFGVAISITALPVLAAVIRERGIGESLVGAVAIAAASGMDVMAWIALAAAVAGSAHSPKHSWLVTIALLTGWTAIMLVIVRRLITWWFSRWGTIPVAIVLAMANAYVSAELGLHVFFGGFLAGLTMAQAAPGDAEVTRVMDSVSILLLPLFFAITGLSLDIDSLDLDDLALLALIITLACVGKMVPAYAAARLGGLPPRQAATVATLLNIRGLTELIALNVGLQSGIISERLFTILVLMALITTIMTSPLLSLIGVPKRNLDDIAYEDPPARSVNSRYLSRTDRGACLANRITASGSRSGRVAQDRGD